MHGPMSVKERMKVAEEEFLLHGESSVGTNACVFFKEHSRPCKGIVRSH